MEHSYFDFVQARNSQPQIFNYDCHGDTYGGGCFGDYDMNNFMWQQQSYSQAQPEGLHECTSEQAAAPTELSTLEELLKGFITESRVQYQSQSAAIKSIENQLGQFQIHHVAIKNLEDQISQIATALNQEANGSFPATTEVAQDREKEQEKENVELKSEHFFGELVEEKQKKLCRVSRRKTEKQK